MRIPDGPSGDEETMDWLMRNLTMSADSVAIGHTGTPAEKTRAIVRRAIEAGVANGLLKVVDAAEWPDYYVPDPPYKSPWSKP